MNNIEHGTEPIDQVELAGLSGWQRLWFIGSTVYLAVFLFLSWAWFVEPRETIEEEWSWDLLALIAAADPTVMESSVYDLRRPYSDLSNVQVINAIRQTYVTHQRAHFDERGQSTKPSWLEPLQVRIQQIGEHHEQRLNALACARWKAVTDYGFAPIILLSVLGGFVESILRRFRRP